MKLGIFGTPSIRPDAGLTIIRDYVDNIARTLVQECDIEYFWSEKRDELEQADVILIPEFAYRQEKITTFLKGERFETPTIFYIVNSGWKYLGARRRKIIEYSDIIWNSSDYMVENGSKPGFWTPCSTYETEHFDKPRTKKGPLIIQSRHARDPLRQAFTIDFLNKWQGDPIDFSTRDTDEALEEAGLLDHPKLNRIKVENMDGFIEYDFILEFMAEPQSRQKRYWSDRQAHAVAHGAAVCTNYPETIEHWESAFSHEDLLSGNYHVDKEAIRRDRDKWMMKNTFPNAWRKTLEALEL